MEGSVAISSYLCVDYVKESADLSKDPSSIYNRLNLDIHKNMYFYSQSEVERVSSAVVKAACLESRSRFKPRSGIQVA